MRSCAHLKFLAKSLRRRSSGRHSRSRSCRDRLPARRSHLRCETWGSGARRCHVAVIVARHGEGGSPDFRHRSVGEIGDQAADLPHEVLGCGCSGRPHPLRRRIIARPAMTIRTWSMPSAVMPSTARCAISSGNRDTPSPACPKNAPAPPTSRRSPAAPAGHRICALAATPPGPRTPSTGHAGNGPQVMATPHPCRHQPALYRRVTSRSPAPAGHRTQPKKPHPQAIKRYKTR